MRRKERQGGEKDKGERIVKEEREAEASKK